MRAVKMIWSLVLLLAIALIVTLMLQSGLKRAERAECVQWVEISQEYPDFYLTDWQIEQCETLGFDIDHLRR